VQSGASEMKVFLVAIAWISVGIADAGFINADLRARFPDLYQSRVEARDARSFSVMWSVLYGPIGAILTPVVTGGYASGWTLNGEPFPCTAHYTDIWCKGNEPSKDEHK
jgi:hypothetical protein